MTSAVSFPNVSQGGNVLISAGAAPNSTGQGGQIILTGGIGAGAGQVFINAGNDDDATWDNPWAGIEDGCIWTTPKPCVGHYNLGGHFVGMKTMPSRFNRWVMNIMGWPWTEERSDYAKMIRVNRMARNMELQ